MFMLHDILCNRTAKVPNSIRIDVQAVHRLCPQLYLFSLTTEMTLILTKKI